MSDVTNHKEATEDDVEQTIFVNQNEVSVIENEVKVNKRIDRHIIYGVEEHPPIYLTVISGFQHALISLSGVVAVSLLVADVTCAERYDDIKTRLLSSSLLMCGICTLLMSLIGSRLPLFQGAASDFLIPLLAMQVLDPTKCNPTNHIAIAQNISLAMNESDHESDQREFVLDNIRELQGSLVAAGAFQFLIGATGLVSLLLRFIGPITIVPTLFLSVVFLVRAAVKFVKFHWGIAFLVAAISMILFLYLGHKKTPVPMWTKKKRFHIFWFPLHQIYSILIAIVIGWIFSVILTACGVFDKDDIYTRTDSRLDIVYDAAWFQLPYPGQFGGISWSTSVFTGFLLGTITSILDSIGDYYAIAKTCNVPPPPSHSVNRGIAIEGLCSLVAGLLGCGHATTTNGGNIGAVGATRVASRDVFIVVGIIYVLFGIIGKISAVFLIIPYPVLGGALVLMYGMFNGVVLSNLQVINLNSSRNLAIIGIAILFGMMVPYWLETTPDAIQTGSESRDGVIKMLLANPNLCGGVLACFLDNTVKGSLEERGIAAWKKMIDDKGGNSLQGDSSVYNIYIPEKLKRNRFIQRLPFIPPLRD